MKIIRGLPFIIQCILCIPGGMLLGVSASYLTIPHEQRVDNSADLVQREEQANQCRRPYDIPYVDPCPCPEPDSGGIILRLLTSIFD